MLWKATNFSSNGEFTPPDNDNDKETDKMAGKGRIHTVQRQMSTQIPIGFCVNLPVSVSISVLDNVYTPYLLRKTSILMGDVASF